MSDVRFNGKAIISKKKIQNNSSLFERVFYDTDLTV